MANYIQGAPIKVRVKTKENRELEEQIRGLLIGRVVANVEVSGTSIYIQAADGGMLTLHYDDEIRLTN